MIELFDTAAEAYLNDPRRTGSVIDLPAEGKVLIAGDLHDHQINFRKTLKLANLDGKGVDYLIVQEMVHSDRLVNHLDLSYRILAETADLARRYPGRVIQLMSNHELSQVMGENIAKHSGSCTEAFDLGLDFVFGDDAEPVREAISRYVKSLPLAVRGGNGVFMAHSIPYPRRRERFDKTVLDRVPTEEDLKGPGGSAHLMVWGRNLTQDWADELSEAWGVEQFVLGHQAADMGYDTYGDTMLVLESDHNHAAVVIFDLAKRYTRAEIIDRIYPLAAVLMDE